MEEKFNPIKVGSIWVNDCAVTCREPFGTPTYQVQGFRKKSKPKTEDWPDFDVKYFASPRQTSFLNTYPEDQLMYDVNLWVPEDASYFYLNGKFLCDYRAWGRDILGRLWRERGEQMPAQKILKRFEPVIAALEEKVGRVVIQR